LRFRVAGRDTNAHFAYPRPRERVPEAKCPVLDWCCEVAQPVWWIAAVLCAVIAVVTNGAVETPRRVVAPVIGARIAVIAVFTGIFATDALYAHACKSIEFAWLSVTSLGKVAHPVLVVATVPGARITVIAYDALTEVYSAFAVYTDTGKTVVGAVRPVLYRLARATATAAKLSGTHVVVWGTDDTFAGVRPNRFTPLLTRITAPDERNQYHREDPHKSY
jgi:hypothetical protein